MNRKKQQWKYILGAVLAVMLLIGLTVPSRQVMADPFEVVADGLNNPRGLEFGPEGALYTGEAGLGGRDACTQHPHFGTVCIGLTASVTRVWQGEHLRVVTGLPSSAELADGSFAIGLDDVSRQGRGNLAVIVGLGGPPELRDALGDAGYMMGRLLKFAPGGEMKELADISNYEAVANPDGVIPPDSDPYAVEAVPGGFSVADAGGNDLLWVDANGKISTVAVFPEVLGFDQNGDPVMMQAAPTSIAVGPDGAVYLGLLHPIFNAIVYKVVPGQDPVVYYQGLPTVIDLAVDSSGNLYTLDIFMGLLVKVAPDGSQTVIVGPGALEFPGGMTIGPDGDLYISNNSVSPGGGSVVRIDL